MDEVIPIPGFGFGILTRAGSAPAPITMVLLNAGLTHRVGPFRSHVHFARHLSRRGVDTFRFDLPRVGDGPGAGVPVDAMVAAVFDVLERQTGARRFALGGICSAADMAWRLAQHDPRIAGVWLCDGFAHRGRWYGIARLRRVLGKPLRQWPAIAWRLLRGMRVDAADPDISVIRDWPTPDAFRRQAAQLLARGVQILATYTGGVSRYLLHPGQLDDTFGRARVHPGLRVEFWPAFDHTLMAPADREVVAAGLGDWLASFAANGLNSSGSRY